MQEAADHRRMGQLLLLNQTLRTNKTSNKALRHAARVTTPREREVQLCEAPKIGNRRTKMLIKVLT